MDLYQAARDGRAEAVRQLIKEGANVNASTEGCWTPLHAASDFGHIDVVRVLIGAGISVDSAHKEGTTPLYMATQNGHSDVVKVLIDAGANTNTAYKDGCTPLYVASEKGHADIVWMLIKADANVNAARKDGITPIHIASQKGHIDIVRVLIDAGADVDTSSKDGTTAMYLASQRGHDGIVRLLIDAGANVNPEYKDSFTPIYIACLYGHGAVVRVLIDAGTNFDAAHKDGFTPIYIATWRGHADIVRMLIDAGADMNTSDKDGFTPLYVAAEKGHSDIVRMLLEAGANVNLADKNGFTPLMKAVYKNHSEIAILLLHAKSNLFLKNNINKSALEMASPELRLQMKESLILAKDLRNGDSSALFRIIELGYIDILKQVSTLTASKRGIGGCTPLMAAVRKGNVDIVKLILYRSNNVRNTISERDDNGKTVLHYAATSGNVAIARLLLTEGADLSIRDADGVTAIITAAAHGNLDVLLTFVNHAKKTGGVAPSGMSACLMQSIASETASDKIEEIVKYLLKSSQIEDVNAVGEDGYTALLHAASRKPGGEEIVKMLLNHGADVNLQTAKEGDSALHLASKAGNAATVRLLLAQVGVQIDSRNGSNQTPLLVSSSGNHPDIAIALIEAGADPNITDSSNETALLHATRHQLREVVVSLLQHGARVDDATIAVAQHEETRSMLRVYHMSQQFHDRSLSMLSKAASGSSPAFEQVTDLVPIISSVYDLRTVLVLFSTVVDTKENKSKLLNDALHHILTQRLVLDDDACTFFHLVLDHCVASDLLTPHEFRKWKVLVTKVNMESADWVIELKKRVNENSYHLKVHENVIQAIVTGMHDIHAQVVANRAAIVTVSNRVSTLQEQVDAGRKLLERVVVHSNHLEQRLRQCESNIQEVTTHLETVKNAFGQRLNRCESNIHKVATHLASFEKAYVQRLDYEERAKKRKAC